jgi:pimeloyl-ACP methyl ester carboxylesterase
VTAARVRRRILQASAVLVFIVLAGATYQGVATALERRQFPHPGKLADVGGHQLHLYCTGDGSPTVLLEAPAAGMSAAWGWVQPAIAEDTRVCSYDRAGLGWSEAGSRTFDVDAVAPELDALVDRGGERPPFVIVGQGLGAALARLHAQRFGDETAALVLIDPPDGRSNDAIAPLVNASPWLARAGVLRATGMLADKADGLPEPAHGALAAFLHRPDHLTRAAQEIARQADVVRRATVARQPDHVRVSVVETTSAGGGAFLVTRDQGERVAAAVLEAVRAVRPR